jgi:hypothetical protein
MHGGVGGEGPRGSPLSRLCIPRFALRFDGRKRKHDAAVLVDGVKRPVVAFAPTHRRNASR